MPGRKPVRSTSKPGAVRPSVPPRSTGRRLAWKTSGRAQSLRRVGLVVLSDPWRKAVPASPVSTVQMTAVSRPAPCTPPHTCSRPPVQLCGQHVTGSARGWWSTTQGPGGLLREELPQPPTGAQRALQSVLLPRRLFHPLRTRVFSVLQSLQEAGCCQPL